MREGGSQEDEECELNGPARGHLELADWGSADHVVVETARRLECTVVQVGRQGGYNKKKRRPLRKRKQFCRCLRFEGVRNIWLHREKVEDRKITDVDSKKPMMKRQILETKIDRLGWLWVSIK